MSLKCCFLGGLIAMAVPLTAGGGELLSPVEASRAGLVQSWQRQLSLINGAQSVVDLQIHVEGSRKRQMIEVNRQVDGTTETLLRIQTDQLDQQGQPIGLDEAKRLAAMQVRYLARRGIEATMAEKSIPQIRLYTLGTDGTVEARDAESGHRLWVTRHGDPDLPYGPMGVSDQFVTFINGNTLIQLSSEDGRMVGSTQTLGTPTFGASIVGPFAFVPTLRGAIEGYPLSDIATYPVLQTSAGQALAEPIAAPGSTLAAWPTDLQFIYVMESTPEPAILFRMHTDGSVMSPVAAASGSRFFFATDNGQVYALRGIPRTGQVLWRQSLGQPVYAAPILGHDRLFLSTVYHHLFALNVTDGSHVWRNPVRQVDAVLCIAGDRLFVRTSAHHLAALDISTGAQVAGLTGVTAEHFLINDQTDRLYLLSAGGAMQCLRPMGAELPNLLVTTDVAPPTPAAEAQRQQPNAPSSQDPFSGGAAGDPFSGGAAGDPFGTGTEAPAGEPAADPFGTGGGAPAGDAPADPFGTEAPAADPFGAAAGDPFSGN